MKIRPVKGHEATLIAAIHEQTATVAYAHIFPDQPFPRAETIVRWETFSGRILVTEEDGAVIGFVAFDEAELHALYVLPDYQGRGIGPRLLSAAPNVSRLWVLRENHVARRFYVARGWISEGKERSAFGVMEMLYCHNTPQKESP